MFYQTNHTQAAERAEKYCFLSLVTLTFDFDIQTRVPCEYGANLFSSSRDISYTDKKKSVSTKNRT